jgi:hypothetical protein
VEIVNPYKIAGRDKVASLWVALALWAAAAASESRLVSQPALLAATWVALFTLPAAYAMCRCDWSRTIRRNPDLGPNRASKTRRGLLVWVPGLFWCQRIGLRSREALIKMPPPA